VKKLLTLLGNSFIMVLIPIYLLRLTWLFFTDIADFNEVIGQISLPITFIFLGILFRNPIEKLISNVSRIKFGDKQFDIKDVKEISNETNETILKSIEPDEKSPEGTNFSKHEVENLMELSAAWGYQMANIGFKTTPKPIIEWKGNIPKIAFGIGSGQNQNEEKFYLINEISETQSELDKIGPIDRLQTGLTVSKEMALKKKLKRLQNLLQEIDPDSIFSK
jgi:hypothetical protein